MKSEHINLKLNDKYMAKLKKIGKTLGMKQLSGTYGGIPMVIRLCITLAYKSLDDIYNVIPTIHPNDLQILLLSIKNKKLSDYQEERIQTKIKIPKQ